MNPKLRAAVIIVLVLLSAAITKALLAPEERPAPSAGGAPFLDHILQDTEAAQRFIATPPQK